MARLTRKLRIRLHDTDAAGILFFARQLYFAHDIYEEFLLTIGFPMAHLLAGESFFVPIVHTESQFLKSVRVGDEVEIAVSVERVGDTSYTLAYELKDDRAEMIGTAKTVHVTVDRKSGAKTPLPEHFRRAIEAFRDKR